MKAEELARAFGYLYREEIELFREIIQSITTDSPVFVNIGAGAGTSALLMRESKPNATIFSIDISPGGPLGGFEGERNAFRDAGNLKLPYQFLIDSGELVKYWANNSIDLLFIDGDHTTRGIQRDLEWVSKVMGGGVVLIHDYNKSAWPDVEPAVLRHFHKEPDILRRTLAVYHIKKVRTHGKK